MSEDQTPEDQTPEDQTPEDQTPEDQTPEDQTPEDQLVDCVRLAVSILAYWFTPKGTEEEDRGLDALYTELLDEVAKDPRAFVGMTMVARAALELLSEWVPGDVSPSDYLSQIAIAAEDAWGNPRGDDGE